MIFDAPLSVRNNNPGNIRAGKTGFKKFGSPQEGLEAMKKDLLLKVSGQSPAMAANFGKGYQPTLRNLISTWAPNTENDTDAYINHVSKAAGIEPDVKLSEADIDKIMPAMIKMEGGDAAADHFLDPTKKVSETPKPNFAQNRKPLDFAAGRDALSLTPEKTMAEKIGSFANSALRQFNQGTTGNFADEIIDPAAAFVASKATGVPYDVLLDYARSTSEQDLKNDWLAHPYLSAGANIAGGISTAVAGGGLINAAGKKYAPKALETITQFAKQAPKTTAFIAGAGSGGVYGSGGSEGPLSERLDDAATGAMWGGPFGVAGYGVAKGASGALKTLSQKLAPKAAGMLDVPMADAPEAVDDLIAGPIAARAGQEQPITPMKLAGILDEDALAQLEQGRTIPMTKGDRTQNVNVQRMEQIAAENGSAPMLAARAQQQAAARKPFENVLGVDVPGDPVDLRLIEQAEAEKAAGAIRGSYDNLKGRENAAWKTARDTGEGVGIRATAIQDNFVAPVKQFLADNQYRTGDLPAFDTHMAELNEIIKEGGGSAFKTTAQLKALEAWKTRLVGMKNNVPMDQKNTSRILGNVTRKYEQFMTDLADDAIVNGDEAAINAFKEAKSLSSQRFGFEESDSGIMRILDTRDLSGEQLVNVILGAEKLTGKGDNGRLVETMLKHAGDRAPEMQEALKRGIMAKSFRRALTTTPDPSDVTKNIVSFDKMRNEVGNIMSKKELFGKVFNPDEQAYMRQLYDDLKLVAGKQKGATNPSGTGAWTADFISGFGKVLNNPLFRGTPVVGLVTNSLDGAFQRQAAAMVTGKAERGLDEFMINAINNLDARPQFYGAISANAVGPDGVFRVTVHPSDAKKEKK